MDSLSIYININIASPDNKKIANEKSFIFLKATLFCEKEFS